MDSNLPGPNLNHTQHHNWSLGTGNDHFSPLKQRVQGVATTGKGHQQQGASLVCPLSPSRADVAVRPSTSAANGASDGGLSALQAALSSLGVRVHDARPATAAATVSGILGGTPSSSAAAAGAGAALTARHDAAGRGVLDISADIQRAVESLNSIGSRLDHESSRGSLGMDHSSAALPQPLLSRPATGQVPAPGQRGGSPRRLLEDASEHQVQQLRRELWQLNRAMLIHSRPSTAASTAPPPTAAAAAPGMYAEPGCHPVSTTPVPSGSSGSGSGGWGQLQSSSSQRQLGRERSLVSGGWAQTAAAVAAEGLHSRAGPSMAPLSSYVQSPGAQQQQQQQQAAGVSPPQQRPGTAMEAVVGPLTAVASLRSLTTWQQQQPLLRQLTTGPDDQQQQQQQQAPGVSMQQGRPPSSGRHQRSHSGSSQQQLLSAAPHQPRPATSSRLVAGAERADTQHLVSEVQSLQRQLHAKEQTESAALSALHKLSQSSRDERVQQLQQQVRDLQQQLLARDTALAEAEAQLQQAAASGGRGGGRGTSSLQGSPGSDRAPNGATIDAAIHRRVVETLGERSLQLQQLQEDMEALQEEGQQQAAALTKRAETYRKQLLQVREQLDLQNATVQQLQDELATASAATAASGSRTARASNRERQLQQQLQQQAAEVQTLQEALQQVCDAVRAADPDFAQQLEGSSSGSGSEDAANLALLLQQRLQAVLSQHSDATAEVERLREQLAQSAAVGNAGRLYHPQQQQQQRVTQELQEAADKLAAAEAQLVDFINVKQQCSSLKRQLAQAVQEREQHKQYIKVLQEQQQELLQQLPGSQPNAVQVIKDLQQQVAVAAAEVQHLKQQQEQAAAAQESSAHDPRHHPQQQGLMQDQSMLSLRALASHSRRNSAHQLSQVTPGEQSAELAALQQRCGELTQQLATAAAQVAAVQAKEARLQAANAQLQEQLYSLKVSAPSASTSTTSIEAAPSALHGSVTCSKPSSDDLAPEVDSVASRIHLLRNHMGKERQEVSSLRQQLEEEQAAKEALAADNAAMEEELGQWKVHADALEADLADLKDQVVTARDTHPIWVAERTRLEALAADKEAALGACRAELTGVQSALAGSRSLVAQLEFELSTSAADYDTLLRRHQALETKHAKAQDSLAELRQRLEGLTGPGGPAAKVKQVQAKVEQLQRRLDSSQGELEAAREQQAELSQQLAVKEEEVLGLEGQVAVLEAELAKQGSGAGIRSNLEH